MNRIIVFILVLLATVLVLALVESAPQGQGRGGGGGGEEETAGNNLSFPVIWSEGFAKTLRGTYGAPVFFSGDCSLPDSPCMIVDGVTHYYQQAEENEWQAGTLNAIDQGFGPVEINWVDWGDNLEAVDWSINSIVRVETVLYKDLLTTMVGYQMAHLYGQGPEEMWGTNTFQYDSPQATIFSKCARLTIQKLTKLREDPTLTLYWDPILGEWIGDVQDALYKSGVWQAADGPGYYTGEVNVPGKVIYGYNWKVRRLNDGAGDYRISFSLDNLTGSADHCDLPLNTFITANTQIVPSDEEEVVEAEPTVGGTAVIDAINGLTYIDVRITPKAGGKGRKK
jgi:hypothetical protein